MSVKVGRRLEWAQNSIEVIRAKNTSGGALSVGDVVVLDTTNSSATEVAFTTTTSANDKAVLGVLIEATASGAYGAVQTKGPTAVIKVSGTVAIAVGHYLSTHDAAGIAQKATSGYGGVFAIALEAYSTGDDSGVIDAWLTGSTPRVDTAATSATYSSPTFDGAITIAGDTDISSTYTLTLAGEASATDALILTLGDILLSDGHLDVTEVNGTTNVVKIDHNGGAIASDNASLYIDDGGDIASGGNMLRLVPTGTPNAASILFEIVADGKVGQAVYVDGDPVGIDLVHLNGGGAMTNGKAVLGITNTGNLATGGALLNLTLAGTPDTAARVFEIAGGDKDAIAMYIDSDAATDSAVQILGAGAMANNKAMLHVLSTGTMVAGSSIVRIEGATTTGGATVYGLEIACNATNLEGLYVSAGTTLFAEAVTMGTTSKLYFLDTGLYIYSSTNGQLDIVADTKLHLDGAIDFGESGGSNAHDIIFYSHTNAALVTFDVSDNTWEFNGVDIQLQDADLLNFGDGDGAAGDVSIWFDDDADGLQIYPTGAAEGFTIGADSHVMNTTLKGTLTIGKDNVGHDVIFYGATASANMTWDESADEMIFATGASIDITADKVMIDFKAGDASTIVPCDTAETGWINVNVDGTKRYIPFYAAS